MTYHLQELTILSELVDEQDDNLLLKMIKIWSYQSLLSSVITQEYCCDSGIDFRQYSSSNHLSASSEPEQLNQLRVIKQVARLFLDVCVY